MAKRDSKFGSYLRELRVKQKLTQEALASLAGIRQSVISKAELKGTPDMETLAKLAPHLRTDYDSLVEKMHAMAEQSDRPRLIARQATEKEIATAEQRLGFINRVWWDLSDREQETITKMAETLWERYQNPSLESGRVTNSYETKVHPDQLPLLRAAGT